MPKPGELIVLTSENGPRPFIDYRDWLGYVVLLSYSAAKTSEEKMIIGLIEADEATNEAEAREILDEVFTAQIENKK